MKYYLKTVAFTVLFLLFWTNGYCANKQKMPLLPVDVYKVPNYSNKPILLTYPARLKSVKKVTIIARVNGVLLKKFYKDGDFVKKGTILYKIEPDIYQANYQAAVANLKLAEANLYKAKRDWIRYKKLYEQKAISQQKMDYAFSQYKSAKAEIDVAKANVKLAKIKLNYTDVKATIDGKTGLKMVDVGTYVTPGTQLVSITQTNPIYAEFSFPDIDILKSKYELAKGNWEKQPVLTAYITKNKQTYKGSVNFVDVNIDPSTATAKAQAVFENKKNLLMPGEFVRVKIGGLIEKNVITIPQKALLQNPMGKIVFVVEKSGVVGIRPVKVKEGENNTFIVLKGLKPGDLVIVNNFFKIKPGMPVKIDKVVNAKEQ